jgi:hypothetical protein
MLLRSVLPPPFYLDLSSFPVPHILRIFDLAVCHQALIRSHADGGPRSKNNLNRTA